MSHLSTRTRRFGSERKKITSKVFVEKCPTSFLDLSPKLFTRNQVDNYIYSTELIVEDFLDPLNTKNLNF